MHLRTRNVIAWPALLLLLVVSLADASDLRLVQAVKQKDKSAVRALLKQRVNVNAAEGDGATALHWAAYHNDLETAERLIAAGANVNAANDLGITPLALAAVNADTSLVEKLLKSGANSEAAGEAGVTPLMEAARAGNVGAVRALLAHEANVNAKDNDREQTALMWAVAQHHSEVVQALLERGANVLARTRVRSQRIMLDQGPRRIVKTSRQDATDAEMGGNTPLLFAAQVGDADSAKLLLAAGANVNDATGEGNSALVVAALAGHGSVAAVLLDAGADPNAAGGGYTALHAAVLRSDLQTVKALLARGANPNATLTKGSRVNRFGLQWALYNTLVGATPLFVAACYLEIDIMRALLAGGASPMLALPDGTTALLVAAGIDVEHQTRPSDRNDRSGDPDQEYGRGVRPESRVVEAIELLLGAGADVNAANAAGDTALHGAAVSGFPNAIQLLADKGAKLDVKNKNGKTPLALTIGGGAEQRQGFGSPRPSPGLQKAQDLLRKLGATN